MTVIPWQFQVKGKVTLLTGLNQDGGLKQEHQKRGKILVNGAKTKPEPSGKSKLNHCPLFTKGIEGSAFIYTAFSSRTYWTRFTPGPPEKHN